MAIQNKDGLWVSYACEDLIEELKSDLQEFGDGNEKVYVIVENRDGVKIYKDYNFIEDPEDESDTQGHGFGELLGSESVETITMAELLDKYKQQNKITNSARFKKGDSTHRGIVYFHEAE